MQLSMYYLSAYKLEKCVYKLACTEKLGLHATSVQKADTPPNDENYIMWAVHGQPKYTLAFI